MVYFYTCQVPLKLLNWITQAQTMLWSHRTLIFPEGCFLKLLKTHLLSYGKNSSDNTFIKYSVHQWHLLSRPTTHLSASGPSPRPPSEEQRCQYIALSHNTTKHHQVNRSPEHHCCITLQTYTAKTLYKTMKYNKTIISEDTTNCDRHCIANYHHTVHCNRHCIANNHHTVLCDRHCTTNNHHTVHCKTLYS